MPPAAKFCSVCDTDMKKDSNPLLCGRCDLYFHASCDVEYNSASKADLAVLSRYKVICVKCSVSGNPSPATEIDSRISDLSSKFEAKFEGMQASLAAVMKKLDTMTEERESSDDDDDVRSSGIHEAEGAACLGDEEFKTPKGRKNRHHKRPATHPIINTADMRKVILEIREKEKTEKCLVVSRVPESKADSAKQRERDDFESAVELLRAVFNYDGSHPTPVDVFRLGKPTAGYDRLLKVEFRHSFESSLVLRNAPNLKGQTKFGKAYIRPSFTREQQQKSAALYEALKKKKEAGDDDYFILKSGLYPDSWKLCKKKSEEDHNLPPGAGGKPYGTPPPVK